MEENYNRKYYLANQEKAKRYAAEKRKKLAKLAKKGLLKKPDVSEKKCSLCKEILPINNFGYRQNRGQYYARCKTCRNKKAKEYRKTNKKEVNARDRKRHHENMKNKHYALVRNYRSRLSKVLERKKDKNSLEFLGCSVEQFFQWIHFSLDCINSVTSEMDDDYEDLTMDNYGNKWHIDHVVPCDAFDFTNKTHRRICFHWSNLTPLSADFNIYKSNKIMIWFILGRHKLAKLFWYEEDTNETLKEIASITDLAMKVAESPSVRVDGCGNNIEDWEIRSQAPKDDNHVYGEGSETI